MKIAIFGKKVLNIGVRKATQTKKIINVKFDNNNK
jgi:hypothetical protein